MSISLLDYHSLEDGELNRLWYEENDPRARDAFRLRWWLGGDTIAGRDLLAEYHTLFAHRCFERGVLTEEDQLEAFREAVRRLVAGFPADPIPKFEDAWLPFVDRAIDETTRRVAVKAWPAADEDRARIEAALAELGDDGAHLRAWAEGRPPELADDAWESVLASARSLIERLDGADVAKAHPLVAVDEPPPSKLDESVAVPHYGAAPLFRYASQSGQLGKREDAHNEWCQPCRQRCVGALLLLRRLRRAFGGEPPPLPAVSPEFDQILQKDDPGVPTIDDSARARDDQGGGSKTGMIVTALIVVAVIVLVVALKSKN